MNSYHLPLVCLMFVSFLSIDDEERQQHYQEIQVDLSVAEENMNDLVDGITIKEINKLHTIYIYI